MLGREEAGFLFLPLAGPLELGPWASWMNPKESGLVLSCGAKDTVTHLPSCRGLLAQAEGRQGQEPGLQEPPPVAVDTASRSFGPCLLLLRQSSVRAAGSGRGRALAAEGLAEPHSLKPQWAPGSN